MEIRKATSVMQIFPKNKRDSNTVYLKQMYKVGSQSVVPGYKMEEVLEITVSFKPQLMVEVEFQDFGSILLTEFISEIIFENEQYRNILDERKAAARANNPQL